MKKVLSIVIVLASLHGFAQNIKEYKATNGVTYHVGDTLRLGLGSKPDGSFLYVEDRGLLGGLSPFGRMGPGGRTQPGRSLPKDYANAGAIIKSISNSKSNGVQKYTFSINVGTPMRFNVYIDDAIAACEVKPCKNNEPSTATVGSVADEIKKLKDLLDSGAITKSEYDAQKKKLLGE